jgi:beta-1,4-mannosyl-glycoprotein beta-1,4-N-acetylglucosaminyltransferase
MKTPTMLDNNLTHLDDSIDPQGLGIAVKAVYYGLEEEILINVTESVIQKCISEADNFLWAMPADDGERARIFGDPIPNLHKKILVKIDGFSGEGFSEVIILFGETCAFNYFNGVLYLHHVNNFVIGFKGLNKDGIRESSDKVELQLKVNQLTKDILDTEESVASVSALNAHRPKKIIDACLFFNEVDTLKIRLGLLYEVVDLFVICESNITFSGLKKPYNFLEHENEFMPWMDKIVFLKFEPDTSNLDFSQKDISYNPASAAWKIEIAQRNFLSQFLSSQDDNDIAIICDVDEIWKPAIAREIRSGEISYDVARLEMQFHYYFLNCEGIGRNNSKWRFPFLSKIASIKSNPNLHGTRNGAILPIIGDAGWHFSYLGGAQKISDKINAFSHQETNTLEINNLQHLERCINLGIDHLNRPNHEWAFHPIDFYPEDIRNEMKKFHHLIKSSLA